MNLSFRKIIESIENYQSKNEKFDTWHKKHESSLGTKSDGTFAANSLQSFGKYRNFAKNSVTQIRIQDRFIVLISNVGKYTSKILNKL